MKNPYRTAACLAYSLASAAFLISCSSSLSYNDAVQKNTKNITDPAKLEDARFLVEAASYNMLATKLSEAAIKSAYSASVVRLAKENLEQHVEMGKELKKLARQEDVILPAEMNEQHQKLLAELVSSDRREFDKAYVRILKQASEEGSQRYAEMATNAKSDDIRAFAARKLDLFESHETELETVDAELLKTY